MAQDDADSHGSGKKPGTPVPVERHCPVEATVDIIGGKYKSLILYKLITGTLRFSQLRRAIPCATPKNADPATARNWKGTVWCDGKLSRRPAQGGIFADGFRQEHGTGSEGHVRLGQGATC